MFITTTDYIPGYEIAEVIAIAMGNTVRAKNIGRDFMASLKGIVGGEVRGYTELLAEARDEAVSRMQQHAVQMGAHAVINVRFVTSEVGQSMSEILAYGTAVRLKESRPLA